jgi:GDPmannose 4,6-dehydratase
MKKTALIFGITGQDGSYLAELLLKKNYTVHGVKRRSSSLNTGRVDHLYQDPHLRNRSFVLHYGDITDSISVSTLIKKIKPDEIYNLAAQSHVAVSFEVPEYTANADAIGALRILEAIKFHGFENKTKFYQAGTSEMFGKVQEIPQNEKTPFYPRSPYGVAKVYAHWITVNYRESYYIFACNGILFNHESPVRGETFVTKKIVGALCKIKFGLQKKLFLGDIKAKIDWGYARDYVEAAYNMMQLKKPDYFVIGSGKACSIEFFAKKCFDYVGLNHKKYIFINKKLLRKTRNKILVADTSKAKKSFKFKPKTDINKLIKIMMDNDLRLEKND